MRQIYMPNPNYFSFCLIHVGQIKKKKIDSCRAKKKKKKKKKLSRLHFYLPPGSPPGDYNLHHVCVYVRACVRECVTQFSLKLLQLHIFGKLLVLMNFYALQYFLGLLNFGLLHLEYFVPVCCSATFSTATTWSVVWKCISIAK